VPREHRAPLLSLSVFNVFREWTGHSFNSWGVWGVRRSGLGLGVLTRSVESVVPASSERRCVFSSAFWNCEGGKLNYGNFSRCLLFCVCAAKNETEKLKIMERIWMDSSRLDATKSTVSSRTIFIPGRVLLIFACLSLTFGQNQISRWVVIVIDKVVKIVPSDLRVRYFHNGMPFAYFRIFMTSALFWALRRLGDTAPSVHSVTTLAVRWQFNYSCNSNRWLLDRLFISPLDSSTFQRRYYNKFA